MIWSLIYSCPASLGCNDSKLFPNTSNKNSGTDTPTNGISTVSAKFFDTYPSGNVSNNISVSSIATYTQFSSSAANCAIYASITDVTASTNAPNSNTVSPSS